MNPCAHLIRLGLALTFFASAVYGWEAVPPVAPAPSSNPQTAAKIELGKRLYFDPRLSQTDKVSCNTCHDVMGSGTDNKPVSTGVDGKTGTRNSPTVWNAAFASVQFWDGRAASLEEQAKGPMVNPVEMGMENHAAVVKKLEAVKKYREAFNQVFGVGPITIDNVVKAIASYERTLITPNSDYDRYLRGDKKALSPSALRGMALVKSVGCITCHSGPNFAGPAMPPGQGFYMRFPTIPGSDYEKKYHLADDLGRQVATGKEEDKHLFRVPSWRNVAITAPYFHNGQVKTLDEAVRVMAKTQLARDLKDSEVKDIVAFLSSLTGQRPKQTMPEPF